MTDRDLHHAWARSRRRQLRALEKLERDVVVDYWVSRGIVVACIFAVGFLAGQLAGWL